MITGKTNSGFEFEIEEEALDDYDLIEDFLAMDSGETVRIFSAIKRLLGEEQEKRLKDHVRYSSGRVSAKRMIEAAGEIFEACNKIKNS